ncbi:ABC transporter family substrate-binding protein [Pseudarthrobacter sp. J1738]|uniref:ABC transporter family substrate-binding protein n=1 Tax=unclassified Pseudarthrobacter TaxID=2647000 RepID=UPI003D28AC50
MKKNLSIGGAVVIATALALTGCGGGNGGNSGPEAGKGADATGDLGKLVSVNAQPVDKLDQGGTVTLPLGNIGPAFNGFSDEGNNADNTTLHSPMDVAGNTGCWSSDYDGTVTLNKDFCTDFKSEVKDGKQTITIKINDKAAYNDGTPIDVKTFQNTWNMLNGKNKDVLIVTPGAYEFVDSVKAGASDKEVVVTTTQPVYPLDALFTGFVNPKVNTPAVFNDGFTGELHPEWMAGPFKLEKYDSAAKTVTMVPNDKWWGAKPVLDRVIFRQLEAAATSAAFKNGEVDMADGRTLTKYKALEGAKDADIRRGQRLFAGGLNINALRPALKDVAVRKAIFTAVDREALRKVRFNGLNWEEKSSGSMMLMPFSPYYQDNYPVTEFGADQAKKVLEDAGYKANDKGVMAKDGKTVSFKITNFGDDPTGLATVQTLQKQLQAAGMDVGIDQRGDADFGKVVGEREFDLTISGYTVGADATDGVKQFYSSAINDNKLGDAELDAEIAKVASIADNTERNKAAMEVEKKHMAKYYSMGVVMNGPEIFFVHKGLANYGADLFKTTDWSTVGWEKGSTHK